MEIQPKFQIAYTEEAVEFLESLEEKVRAKVVYNIGKCRYYVDRELFKKLEGSEIWEFRTLYAGIQYRLFAFWDTESETVVVATHGIVKKTQKTPAKEIDRAERIMKEYFEDKRRKI